MRQSQSIRTQADQRLALLGRLRMAEWIEMPEKTFAKQVEEMEKDPLFQNLFFGSANLPSAIHRQRWPGGRMASIFYEDAVERVSGEGERVQVEETLSEHASLLPLIRKIGQKNFESYFLHGEEAISLPEIAQRVGISEFEAGQIHDLLLDLGSQCEFYTPDRDPSLRKSYACIARISISNGNPEFEFYSPYWARGLYHIDYDRLEAWKRSKLFSGEKGRRLGGLVKKIEVLNFRQNTLFRVLKTLTEFQAKFLRTQDETLLKPISLSKLGKRLDLAQSTVSRAISGRSVHMPWGYEAPLSTLAPGQRWVLRQVMAKWIDEGVTASDATMVERFQTEYGIKISRRTVNAVRNRVIKSRTV